MIECKRIGDLSFKKATYICEEPKHPAYHINYYYPNSYYGREDDYDKVGEFYIEKHNDAFKIHESCFKSPETSIAIAAFLYRNDDEEYEFRYIADRPVKYLNFLNEDIFKALVAHGFRQLNPEWYKNDENE